MKYAVVFATSGRFLLLLLAAAEYIVLGAESLGNEIATLNYNDAFAPEDDYRQSFCELINEQSNETKSLGDLLSGRQLNPMVFAGKASKYFNYDPESGINPESPGLFGDIVDIMAERGNFTWRNTFGHINDPKAILDMNRSFTDFIQWSIDRYDILIGEFDMTAARINSRISFCLPVNDNGIIMVRNVEPNTSKVDWLNWLSPFTPDVWWVLLGTIIISAVSYMFIEFFENLRDERSLRSWTMENFYLAVMAFTQNFSHESSTLGGRIFSISFSFWAMLIGAAYTANLASLLVVENTAGFVLVSIEDAIQRDLNIGVGKGTGIHEYLISNFPQATLVPINGDKQDWYTALINNKCDVLVDTSSTYNLFSLQEEYNPNCFLSRQGRELNKLYQSFATKLDPVEKCSSVVNEVFNYHLQLMKTDGTLDRLWKNHAMHEATRESCNGDTIDEVAGKESDKSDRRDLRKNGIVMGSIDDEFKDIFVNRKLATSTDSKETSAEEESSSLTLKQMAGTFLIHAVGMAFAMLCSLLSYFKKKNDLKQLSERWKNRTISFQKSHAMINKIETENISNNSSTIESIQRDIDHLKFMLEKIHKKLDIADHADSEQEKTK